MPEQPAASPSASGEGFDVLLERLRGVVEKLEGGSLSLEESLAAFEEGVALSRRGTSMLDAVERRVEILTRQGDEEKIVPFTPEEPAAGEAKSERKSGR